MQEQHEKEGILTRELDRLRAHMMEVEETYTAEALRLEEQVHDLQGKLNVAEDRLRNVSTAHTSARYRLQLKIFPDMQLVLLNKKLKLSKIFLLVSLQTNMLSHCKDSPD